MNKQEIIRFIQSIESSIRQNYKERNRSNPSFYWQTRDVILQEIAMLRRYRKAISH